MATGRDIIKRSLRLIGAISQSETPAASEITDGLTALNQMLGSWSNESLMIHSRNEETFTLTASQQSYTMGSGGDFNTTRPNKIDAAVIKEAGVDVYYPMKLVDYREWKNLIVKATEGDIPRLLWVNYTATTLSLNFWPVPASANSAVIYSWNELSQLANADASFTLPPGYLRAISYNLAVELAPEYGAPVMPEVHKIAAESKGILKRKNQISRPLQCDPAVLPKQGVFNWKTGE